MKKSVKTTVKVQFVQESKKNGVKILETQPIEIESANISEVAGTIAKRILFARLQLLKYGAKIKGFSFNRRFNMKIQINDLTAVDFTELYGGVVTDANCTLIARADNQDKTEVNFKQFADKIYDLVRLSMTGELLCITDATELQAEIPAMVAPVNAKLLTA